MARPFCWYQYFWPSGLDLDFDLLLEKPELVAAGGISPVRTGPNLVLFLTVQQKGGGNWHIHCSESNVCIHYCITFLASKKYDLIFASQSPYIYSQDFHSDAENSRSACFDWHNFIRTGIRYEILLHILLFGLALFLKYLILTCLFKKISASLNFQTIRI